MKKIFTCFLTVLLCCFAVPARAQIRYDVLFVGNSYTYANNLPDMVAQLARAGGDTLVWNSNTPGGYTFEGHSTNATTLSLIAQGGWDYVVLQEQSQRPSFSPQQVAVEVYPYAAILDSLIHAADSCTETVFYMTWGRKYGDQNNCQFYPPVCTYQGMQQRLYTSYMTMADVHNATVAPVGMAWKRSIAADSTLNLYVSDNSHPSTEGTYLAACVFYATLYRKTPLGLPWYANLDTTRATWLQNIAALSVMDSFPQYHIGHRIPDPAMAWNSTLLDVDFTGTGHAQAWAYSWDFGDGSTGTGMAPTHSYTNPGTYPVTLTIDDGCYAATVTDTVTVFSVEQIAAQPETAFTLAPNPAAGTTLLRGSEAARITLMDLRGLNLRTWDASATALQQGYRLDLSNLPAGVYLLRAETATTTHYLRLRTE